MLRTLAVTSCCAALLGCSDSGRENAGELVVDTQAPADAAPDLSALLYVVNSDLGEGWLSLSADNRIAVFSRQVGGFDDQRLFMTRWVDDGWTEPSLAPFATDVNERGGRFSGDGNSVVFSSTRPETEADSDNDWNIWSATMNETGGWNEPVALAGINSPAADFHPSATSDGRVFFGSPRDGGLGRSDIYIGRPSESGWTLTPAKDLNTEFSEPDPFIAPDGSYVIFARTNAPDGFGGDDLYVAFSSDHGWSVPKNLGDKVNTPEYEYGAFVTADGKSLFYTTWASGTPQVASIELSELDPGL